MKNLSCLILVVLLTTGCLSDHLFVGSPDLSKATIEQPARHVVWFESIPDPDKKLECGLPASGHIKGHCNLLGDIIPEQSPFTIWHWHWDPNSPHSKIIESIEGAITGANGDSYYFTGIITNNLTDQSFSGIMYINGGIGNLEGIIGECYMTGSAATGVAMWTAEGSVALQKKQENQVEPSENKDKQQIISFLKR